MLPLVRSVFVQATRGAQSGNIYRKEISRGDFSNIGYRRSKAHRIIRVARRTKNILNPPQKLPARTISRDTDLNEYLGPPPTPDKSIFTRSLKDLISSDTIKLIDEFKISNTNFTNITNKDIDRNSVLTKTNHQKANKIINSSTPLEYKDLKNPSTSNYLPESGEASLVLASLSMEDLESSNSDFRPFLDLLKLKVKSGNGGAPEIGRRRNHNPGKGGGYGGHGGSIYMKADIGLTSLHTIPELVQAASGSPGVHPRRGRDGADRIIKVPVGTIVRQYLKTWPKDSYKVTQVPISSLGAPVSDKHSYREYIKSTELKVLQQSVENDTHNNFFEVKNLTPKKLNTYSNSFIDESTKKITKNDLRSSQNIKIEDYNHEPINKEIFVNSVKKDTTFNNSKPKSNLFAISSTINQNKSICDSEIQDKIIDSVEVSKKDEFNKIIGINSNKYLKNSNINSSIEAKSKINLNTEVIKIQSKNFKSTFYEKLSCKYYDKSRNKSTREIKSLNNSTFLENVRQIDDTQKKYIKGCGEQLAVFKHQFLHHNDMILISKGGLGGLGASGIKKRDGRKPEFTTPIDLQLELRLDSDIALIGFPNSGKTSLLSSLTSATQKISSIPNSTVVPRIGFLKYSEGINLRLLDTPPLNNFEHSTRNQKITRHLYRAKVLCYVINLSKKSKTDHSSKFNSDIFEEYTNEEAHRKNISNNNIYDFDDKDTKISSDFINKRNFKQKDVQETLLAESSLNRNFSHHYGEQSECVYNTDETEDIDSLLELELLIDKVLLASPWNRHKPWIIVCTGIDNLHKQTLARLDDLQKKLISRLASSKKFPYIPHSELNNQSIESITENHKPQYLYGSYGYILSKENHYFPRIIGVSTRFGLNIDAVAEAMLNAYKLSPVTYKD